MENQRRTLRTILNAAIARIHPFVLLIFCVGILLAYLMGMYVTGSIHSASRWMGAMLACTSVVVVLQKPGYKESLQIGWMRVLGTFVGALVAYVYLLFLPFSVIGMLLCVVILETIFMLLDIYNNGHIATITMLIIMLVSQMSPDADPAMNCLLRFLESAVGVGVGIGLLWLAEQWSRLRQRLLRIGQNRNGQPVNMDTMPLRWGHFRVLIVASLGQVAGGGLATLIGIVIPMLQIVRHPELTSLQQGALACMSLVGITVGSVLFGAWSDRRGYLSLFRFCPALILAASLVAIWADGTTALAIALFLMGLGIGGEYSLDADYISEIMPRRWRLSMVGAAKAFSSLGNILAAAAGFLLLRAWHDPHFWNRFFLLVSLLAVVMLLTRVRFAQSPGWLIARGSDEEAERAVRYFLGPDVELGELRDKPRNPTEQPSRRELFGRANRAKVLFSGIPWACSGMGVYGIGVFLPALVMALGLDGAGSGSFGHIVRSVETTVYINLFVLAGFLLGLSLVGRCSHVRMQTWGFLLCAAGLALLLAAYLLHGPTWIAVAGFMAFELFLNAGPHLITFLLPSQIYSVAERGSGGGIAAAFGKAGAIASVLFMPLLLERGGLPLALCTTIGILLLGAFVTVLFGREVLPRQTAG